MAVDGNLALPMAALIWAMMASVFLSVETQPLPSVFSGKMLMFAELAGFLKKIS